MKKLILVAILTLSQFAMALGLKGETKVLNREASRLVVESALGEKKFQEAVKTGKLTTELKASVATFISEASTKVTGLDVVGLTSLVEARPETLVRITELLTEAMNGTAAQKEKAALDLQIIASGSALVRDNSDAETLEKVSSMPNYNKEAKDFKLALEKEMKLGGLTIAKAIEKASKGKITLEQIRSCIL